MKKLFIYILPVMLVLLLMQTTTKAQNIINDADRQKALTNTIGGRLNVNNQKANEMAVVLNYRRNEILELMKDKTMDPREKDKLLRYLFAQRNKKMDSVFTPMQKMMMVDSNNQAVKKAGLYRKNMRLKLESESKQRAFKDKTLPFTQNK
jgi:hypothetical protein